MTILDIDQDFLYDSKFNQIYTVEKIFEKFNLKGRNIPAKIFINHDEAYYEIIRTGLTDIKLIHLDRHDDVWRPEYNTKNLNLGTWISHLIKENRVTNFIWIAAHNSLSTEDYLDQLANKQIPSWRGPLELYPILEKIEVIYFTISPGFCPNNNELLKFIECCYNKIYEQHIQYI